jgi:biopolymer transport protein ExbB
MKKLIVIVAAVLSLAASSHAEEQSGHSSAVQFPATQAGEEKRPPAVPALSGVPANSTDASERAASKPHEVRPELHELSPWSMFLSADALVKAVMISLAFASLITWTVFFAKTIMLRMSQRQLARSLVHISSAKTLPEAELALGPSPNVLTGLLAAAREEMQLSGAGSNGSGIKERAASRFSEIIRSESRAMRQGMGVLATIGATAPFVGLFGTVWGIMNSFIGISKSQTTNLAVVAPGIAEALLATAFGLAAAIPAVMIYNYLTRMMRGYLDLAAEASGATGRLLSRTLEQGEGRLDARAAE